MNILQSFISSLSASVRIFQSNHTLPSKRKNPNTHNPPPPAKHTTPQLHPSFNAANLIPLADLSILAPRTALTGPPLLLDILLVCPGLHRHQANLPSVARGEYPACAAMTTGYVFRVENEGMVYFCQRAGQAGSLVEMRVEGGGGGGGGAAADFTAQGGLCVVLARALTGCVLAGLVAVREWSGVGVVGLLVAARAMDVVAVRSRGLGVGWKGASEPGVKGDLLVLLSQDRWVRIRGMVDDLKAVVSGQWLREAEVGDRFLTAVGTLLVYAGVGLTWSVSAEGKVLLLVLFLGTAALLGLANEWTTTLRMHGRVVTVSGPPKKYSRRRDLADQLIEEMGRDDWAVRLGMIVKEQAGSGTTNDVGPKTM